MGLVAGTASDAAGTVVVVVAAAASSGVGTTVVVAGPSVDVRASFDLEPIPDQLLLLQWLRHQASFDHHRRHWTSVVDL